MSKRLWTDERIRGHLHSYVGGSKTISFLDATKMRDEYEALAVELKKAMDTQCLIRYAVSDELDVAKASIAEWQPIETVPHDVPVLVYYEGVIMVAVLLTEPYLHWKGRDWLSPSHWRPLPPPPTIPEGTAP